MIDFPSKVALPHVAHRGNRGGDLCVVTPGFAIVHVIWIEHPTDGFAGLHKHDRMHKVAPLRRQGIDGLG